MANMQMTRNFSIHSTNYTKWRLTIYGPLDSANDYRHYLRETIEQITVILHVFITVYSMDYQTNQLAATRSSSAWNIPCSIWKMGISNFKSSLILKPISNILLLSTWFCLLRTLFTTIFSRLLETTDHRTVRCASAPNLPNEGSFRHIVASKICSNFVVDEIYLKRALIQPNTSQSRVFYTSSTR